MVGPIQEVSEETQIIREIQVIKEQRGEGEFEVNQSGEAPEPLQ